MDGAQEMLKLKGLLFLGCLWSIVGNSLGSTEQKATPFSRYVVSQGKALEVAGEGVTLAILLQALAQVKPFDFVLSPAHNKVLSIHLHQVSWEKAIHDVVSAAGLQGVWRAGVLSVVDQALGDSVLIEQVHIKAYITSIDEDYFREMGFKLLSGNRDNQPNEAPHHSMSLLKPVLWTGLKYIDGYRLGTELTAMEGEGRGRVLSSPELVTTSGRQAFVETGDEIPLWMPDETSEGKGSVIYKKAVLRLSVTPQVVGDKVLMKLHIVQDKLAPASIKGHFVIHTRQIDTAVRVKNRATVALGGIYETDKGRQRQCIPGINHLPWIGKLFCSQAAKASKHQLMVFLTPTILGHDPNTLD